MNKATRDNGITKNAQSAFPGKLSNLQKILKLAFNSFSKEKYSMTIDYCRKAVNAVNGTDQRELAAEAYYIWCLSCFKMNKYDDAKKVCYEARLKLGNYLDLVYFEILITAVSGGIDRIPKFAKSYIELYEAAGDTFNPLREKTHDRIGEVLLMSGQALEQAQKKSEALDIYKKYLSIFPDDDPIKERVGVLANQTDR